MNEIFKNGIFEKYQIPGRKPIRMVVSVTEPQLLSL